MSKVVESSYQTVDETLAAVERLLSEGRLMSDIVIVTSRENHSNIQNRTVVEVDRIAADGDKSMWEKFKNMFTDEPEDSALEHYGIDKKTALRYDSTLQAGNYVILVEEKADIPLQYHLKDEPIVLSQSTNENITAKPIGQSGSGTKIAINTSDPRGQSAEYNDQDSHLKDEKVVFDDNRFPEKKEDPTDTTSGFQKARQTKPIGQSGSGTRVSANTSQPTGKSAEYNDQNAELSERTVQSDENLFSGKKEGNQTTNSNQSETTKSGFIESEINHSHDIKEKAKAAEAQDEAIEAQKIVQSQNEQIRKNPLQGDATDATDFVEDNFRQTAVEDSETLPRFNSSSITGQPNVDPLLDHSED